MDQIIVSRHGESVATAGGVENGDPRADRGLTSAGQGQAGELGRQIAGDPIDICITSRFPRVQQTAALALSGREVGCSSDANLDDIRYGRFEGKSRDSYRDWAQTCNLNTPIPGGESRLQVAARLCAAFDAVLARPEHCALVVTHELLIDDLLSAIQSQPLSQVHADVPFATPHRLAASDVARGVAFLRGWLASQEDRSTSPTTSR